MTKQPSQCFIGRQNRDGPSSKAIYLNYKKKPKPLSGSIGPKNPLHDIALSVCEHPRLVHRIYVVLIVRGGGPSNMAVAKPLKNGPTGTDLVIEMVDDFKGKTPETSELDQELIQEGERFQRFYPPGSIFFITGGPLLPRLDCHQRIDSCDCTRTKRG